MPHRSLLAARYKFHTLKCEVDLINFCFWPNRRFTKHWIRKLMISARSVSMMRGYVYDKISPSGMRMAEDVPKPSSEKLKPGQVGEERPRTGFVDI